MNFAATTPLIFVLLILLLVVAFSSGTEVAMLSVNRYRIRHRAQQGELSARVLDRLLKTPDEWLGANLVILAAASVFASAIATILAQRSGYHYAIPLAGALLTVVVIVFCELAPKIYATANPEGVALHAAGIYRVLVWVARPALWLTNMLAYGFLRIFGVGRATNNTHALNAEELRTVVSEAAPMIPMRHRQMLLSILDLGHVTVTDIMIPRQEIAGIDVNGWRVSSRAAGSIASGCLKSPAAASCISCPKARRSMCSSRSFSAIGAAWRSSWMSTATSRAW